MLLGRLLGKWRKGRRLLAFDSGRRNPTLSNPNRGVHRAVKSTTTSEKHASYETGTRSIVGLVIRYVTGDATRLIGVGPRVIVHVCNDVGKWGAGFVLALSRRWREPEAAYRAWYRSRKGTVEPPLELGSVQFVDVAEQL
jgi:hypothetical protein